MVLPGLKGEDEMKLSSENVQKIFDECFSETGDKKVVSVVHEFFFNSNKLNENSDKIRDMLYQLPENFMKDSGGGWSFLMACNDKNGEQWTGLHLRMEQLFAMGEAIGKVKSLLPRELWKALPGGVPYYVVI